MRAEVRFAFLSEEEKRRLVWLCLNHVKPVRSPQAKLVKLVSSSASILYWRTDAQNQAPCSERTAIMPGFETIS